DAVAGAVAYDVVWRKTTDPDFPEENATRTTATKIDLQESKDNVIFGVRSVGANGQRSLVAIPGPERGTPPPAATPTPQPDKK
ncbi:MAG: peptidase M28, partial [Terriglobales bacterium]